MTLINDKRVVSLKGYGNGLRLIIEPEESQGKIISEATDLLKSASTLVDGSRITIDTGFRVIDEDFLLTLLKRVIWPLDLNISTWKSDDISSVIFLKNSGFNCYEERSSALKCDKKTDVPSLVVNKSLRSGQKIEHNGDVIVFGHVHDGSEVVSAGNVFVFGRLRGLVHAGSNGDDNCFITADSFMARQIRIGKKVSNELDPESQHWWECPVIISTDGEKLNVRKRI